MQKIAEDTGRKYFSLLQDSIIKAALLPFAAATCNRLELEFPAEEGIELQEDEDEMVLAVKLLDTIKARRPDVYDIARDRLLLLQHLTFSLLLRATDPSDETTRQILLQAMSKAMPPTLELEHFPDNPIGRVQDLVTGEDYLTGTKDAKPKHYMQIEAWFRSLRPEKASGRPKGQKTPRGGRPRIDPDEALAIHQATLEGLDWKQIARKVLHRPIPTDHKGRDCLRKWINARQIRGASLSRTRKK